MAALDPVVRTDAAHRPGVGVGAFLLALVTAGALAHVGVRMKGIEVAYALGREKRINTQLEETRRRLNIEIGMLKDPGRVVAIARDRLKMGPPAPSDVVRLAPGQILGAAPAVVEAPKRPEHAARPRVARHVKDVDQEATPESKTEAKTEAKSDVGPAEAPDDEAPAPRATEGE